MNNHSSSPAVIIASGLPRARRIDLFLSENFSDFSRSFFKRLADDGQVFVNGSIVKPSFEVANGMTVAVVFPEPRQFVVDREKTGSIPVEIVFEHEHFLIINKPPRLVVHPPSQRSTQVTLADWIVSHFSEIAQVGYSDRPGIVHRLDRDTSGLMVIPRTSRAHLLFSQMFRERTLKKKYRALVHGKPPVSGSIDFNIGRHPHENKMTHIAPSGRSALTHFRVLEQYPTAALVELTPVTGRTHQLRVHCAALGYPIVGDPIYGNRSPLIDRQALHAYALEFTFEGQAYAFSAEMPHDFQDAQRQLR